MKSQAFLVLDKTDGNQNHLSMAALILENSEVRKLVSVLSVEAYHRLSELGLISSKTELIEGVVFDKMTKSPDYGYYSDLLFEFLSAIKPQDCIIRCEKPLTLNRSEPEPDISIIKGSLKDFKNVNPSTAVLIVEIANTSISYDREKISVYAEAGVENYWIADLKKMQIETYQKPIKDEYLQKTVYGINDQIPIFDSFIDLQKVFTEKE